MNFYTTDEAKKAATASNLWENVTKPVMKNNSRKFLAQTSEADLRIFESVAGSSLDRLGYDRVLVPKGQEVQYDAATIAEFNAENDRLKKLAWENLDDDDRRRRAEQRTILDDIATRNAARRETVGVR